MQSELEYVLDECLREMQQGRSIEECLRQHPQHAVQLKPLLELSQVIKDLPQLEPSHEMAIETLLKINQQLSSKRRRKTRYIGGSLLRQPRLAWAFSVAFFLAFSLFSISKVAADSAPGDFLYPVKLTTEKVRFLLTFKDERKAELRITFSDERLSELLLLMQRSGTFNPDLLKAMLEEARLALDENTIPSHKAPVFLAKLDHVTSYQKDVLEQIRSRIDLPNQKAVDEAIMMCGNRSAWMKQMMEDMRDSKSGRDCCAPMHQPSPKDDKSQSRRWRWGPGCDWMR